MGLVPKALRCGERRGGVVGHGRKKHSVSFAKLVVLCCDYIFIYSNVIHTVR